MDLPTYTSIWRIEKRLYKLYDFRLPMPVPVGQIAVFAAITVPYVVLLTMLGLPFSHTLFWLYVLPPGVITWLATRPVLESKRLPELVISQVRYLGEPGTWCRMAPLAEKDDIVVVGRVWRRARRPAGSRRRRPGHRRQTGVAAGRGPRAPPATARRARARGPPAPVRAPAAPRRRGAAHAGAAAASPGQVTGRLRGPGPGSSRSPMTAGRSTRPRLVGCR